MTTFLNPGLGGIGASGRSTETKALQGINSRNVSYANKDFVKNIAWLNQSVDTLSAYTQKLQSGVDSANQNAVEQIQGFAADLFTLFAGLEPTGIELGDLKYVIQGIGALLGIDPDTPFPMNLLQAALHLFETYIIPLDQFTDVIFEAIIAWAEDLGLSEEFISSIRELWEAIVSLTDNFDHLFESLGDLLGAFGFGFTSTSGIGDLWDALVDLIDGLALEPLKPVLSLLADFGVPFINALTSIVELGNRFLDPLSFISGNQVAELGSNVVPSPSAQTTVWSVGGDTTNAWRFDAAQSVVADSSGSLTTLGTGVAKRVATQKKYNTQAGKKFTVKAQLRWAGIPTGANDFGLQVIWFIGDTESSTTNLNISPGHGATGGWTLVTQADVTVPINVDGFKIACRVGTGITTGQVWVDDPSAQLQGFIEQSVISGLIDTLAGFLTNFSPLNALNLFGLLGPNVNIPFLSIGALGNNTPNMLVSANFPDASAFEANAGWSWDGAVGRNANGSAKVVANGQPQELNSIDIAATEGQKVNEAVWIKWASVGYTGSTHVQLAIKGYLAGVLVSTTVLQSQTFSIATQATWQQLSGTYTVPAGIDAVRVQLKVNSNVTSGTVWFDDAEAKKTGLIQLPWVENLVDMFTGVLDMFGLGALGDLIGLDTGDVWGTIITTIMNPLSLLQDTFARNLLDEFSDAISSILNRIPFVGGTLSSLWDQFFDFIDFTDDTAATTTDTADELTETRESLVGNINGSPIVNPTEDEFDEAVAGQSQTISDTAAQVAALQAVQTGSGNNGHYAIETFEYVNSTNLDAGLWAREYLSAHTSSNATINTVDGHNAGMTRASGSNIDILEQYIGPFAETLTTYQKVTVTVAEKMVGPAFLGSTNTADVIYCRMKSDRTKWVRVVWESDGRVFFQYKNGGSITALGSAVTGKGNPAVGAILSLEAGTTGGERIFRLQSGTQIIHTVTDGSAVTALEKGAGFGQFYDDRLPGKLAHFSISDNTPTPVTGTAMRVYRNATGTIAQGSGDTVCPSGTFDTVDYVSSDLTWDDTTSKVTVTKGGMYLVTVRMKQTDIGEADRRECLLYKNGSIHTRIGGIEMLDPPNPTNTNVDWAIGVGVISLAATDYIQIGKGFSGAASVIGESTGQETYFSLTKVG